MSGFGSSFRSKPVSTLSRNFPNEALPGLEGNNFLNKSSVTKFQAFVILAVTSSSGQSTEKVDRNSTTTSPTSPTPTTTTTTTTTTVEISRKKTDISSKSTIRFVDKITIGASAIKLDWSFYSQLLSFRTVARPSDPNYGSFLEMDAHCGGFKDLGHGKKPRI